MSHIELLTRIRAELGNGNHLDAWELALESQDAVALAYVEAHAPITMVSRSVNVIYAGNWWVAEWRTGEVAELRWAGGLEPYTMRYQTRPLPRQPRHPAVFHHLVSMLAGFLGEPSVMVPTWARWCAMAPYGPVRIHAPNGQAK